MQGTARVVLQQMRKLQGLSAERLASVQHTDRCRQPLDAATISKCSVGALNVSIKFFTCLSIDSTYDEVADIFDKWCKKKGHQFFQVVTAEESSPEDFILEELGCQEMSDYLGVPHEAECQLIQAVQDRAAVQEELSQMHREMEQDDAAPKPAADVQEVEAEKQDSEGGHGGALGGDDALSDLN